MKKGLQYTDRKKKSFQKLNGCHTPSAVQNQGETIRHTLSHWHPEHGVHPSLAGVEHWGSHLLLGVQSCTATSEVSTVAPLELNLFLPLNLGSRHLQYLLNGYVKHIHANLHMNIFSIFFHNFPNLLLRMNSFFKSLFRKWTNSPGNGLFVFQC